MSGGAMDYICYQVKEAAELASDPDIQLLLKDVAKVLHDEEWWRSYDISEEDYRKTLAEFKRKWLGTDSSDERYRLLMVRMDKLIEQLRREIAIVLGVD